MSEGFDEYLSKPIISEELEQMLSRLVPGRIVTDSLPSVQKSGEPGSSLLNIAKGLEYSDNDPEFYRELLRLFTEEAPKSLERLSSALDDNDLELYTTLGARLKNNARGIGADSAGELLLRSRADRPRRELGSASGAAFKNRAGDNRSGGRSRAALRSRKDNAIK